MRLSTLPLVLALALGQIGTGARAADDLSAAEQAIFMDKHLSGLKAPVTLQYSYRRSGTDETAFEDRVALRLRAGPGGACCAAEADFLSGEQRLELPAIELAEANPVVLYFLEREVREMQRLTQGQQNYFRKRIRMAVYQDAQLNDREVYYRGRPVAAREIVIRPYSQDPLRARYESLADKHFVFTLSAAVPGGVVALRSEVDAPRRPAPPTHLEELLLDGVSFDPPAR